MLTDAAFRASLARLYDQHASGKQAFYAHSEERRRELFHGITRSRDRHLSDALSMLADVGALSAGLEHVRRQVEDYFRRSDWALLDLVALAACTPAAIDELCEAIAPNALLYHALRMIDDVLDDHHDYKGGALTLFGEVSSSEGAALAMHANLLPAMLLAVHVSASIPIGDRLLLERTLAGMLHESFAGAPLGLEEYRRIAGAKMGAYGSFLYQPVVARFAPDERGPLGRFLTESFVLSQVANDLHDVEDDQRRGQPNFWLLAGDRQPALRGLRDELEEWAERGRGLGAAARPYAHARVTDLMKYLLQGIDDRDAHRPDRSVAAT